VSVLETINTPEQLRTLSIEQLTELADQLRQFITKTVSATGGHLASNLGVVELTLALHYCFDFKRDRLLWDVGHQCYVHKILTGRRARFGTLRQAGGISGFPDIHESPYDQFTVGHAGTAVATAVGLARGEELTGANRRVVAVVGDASIVNGLSFEGLNNAGLLKRQLLIILNDNSMAIDVTQGALARHMMRLRLTETYEDMKRRLNSLLDHVPGGKSVHQHLRHIKQAVKTTLSPGQIFEQLGITYIGPIDGHDLHALIRALNVVKSAPYPILLHVHTQKGRGIQFASNDPCAFHSPSGYDLDGDNAVIKPGKKSFTAAFGQSLTELAARDPAIVAITAAMPDGTGLVEFKKRFPRRYLDVGICESAAVDVAAGLAKTGLKPVVAIYSTFLQRAFDQIWQEVVLQGLPVVFCMDRAGLVGSDGAVHHGFCDQAFLQALPDVVCMAPADEHELHAALELALTLKTASAIRYPRDVLPEPVAPPEPFELGVSRTLRHGRDAVIVSYGALTAQALCAAEQLAAENIDTAVISARFARPLDERMLGEVLGAGVPVVLLEDHGQVGGFGSAVLQFAYRAKLPVDHVLHLAIPGAPFVPHATRAQQLSSAGLDAGAIAQTIRRTLRGELVKQQTPAGLSGLSNLKLRLAGKTAAT